MLTEYRLNIDGAEHRLSDSDLRNWDEIQCTFKRADYDGAVRSFSSKFEFVNDAYELLLGLYLRDGFNAEAYVAMYTQTDRWEYLKRFECRIDFSTVEWDGRVFSASCVDNTLEALIKANKGTVYEFGVGTDIMADRTFNFERIPMQESATYEFTQGEQYNDCADILVTFRQGELPWVGNVGSEIAVNGSVYFKEDQEESLSNYCIKAEKDVSVSLDWAMTWCSSEGRGTTNLYARVRRLGNYIDSRLLCNVGNGEPAPVIITTDDTELPDPVTSGINAWALVDGIVWIVKPTGHGAGYEWENTGMARSDYFRGGHSGQLEFDLVAGDEIVITHGLESANDSVQVRFISSKFAFSWRGVGNTAPIDVMRPSRVARSLLEKIADGNYPIRVRVSPYDARLAETWVLAAESARGIEGAKLYSSFTQFCDWMSAVFGYVYYIGDTAPSTFAGIQNCERVVRTANVVLDDFYPGHNPLKVVYLISESRFCYHEGGALYRYWESQSLYNTEAGTPRTDMLFRFITTGRELFMFPAGDGPNRRPVYYDMDEDNVADGGKTVYFVHRSELFNTDHKIMVGESRDFKYSIDNNKIYSEVKVGYDTKEYDSINGRDEFNFNITYTTGCSVSDRKLSLLSKYRADFYGIEFAVQKRGEDTTDSKSDKDVFFVHAREYDNRQLKAIDDVAIGGTLSDAVCNGAFSPLACLRANAGYIGMMSDGLVLKYTSAAGNTDVTIDGESLSADVSLGKPDLTCGQLEFSTGDVDTDIDIDSLVEVECDGLTYRGYIKEISMSYAKEETAKYKLIVKEVIQ